jgi:hypothetical protein
MWAAYASMALAHEVPLGVAVARRRVTRFCAGASGGDA